MVDVIIAFRIEALSFNGLRMLAAATSFFLIFNAGNYLRIFENTSFFIHLIHRTIVDIQFFAYLYFIALLACGFPTVFIYLNWQDHNSFRDLFRAVLYQ